MVKHKLVCSAGFSNCWCYTILAVNNGDTDHDKAQLVRHSFSNLTQATSS